MLYLSDYDERMKMVDLNFPEKINFAERAEGYYQKRPQLLALLNELYNGYLCLADRYCRALAKNGHHHRRYSFPIPSADQFGEEWFDHHRDGNLADAIIDSSDAESSLSYQQAAHQSTQSSLQVRQADPDLMVADLVIRTVDCELMLHELAMVERRSGESSRRVELQKSLLNVLESERVILLNENARLVHQVAALVEENRGLVSESIFMKRKAAELAACVFKMREDHGVCTLSRKIENLQGQINGLEKRNREYYDRLVKHEEEKNRAKTKRELSFKGLRCFQVHEGDVPWVIGSGNTVAKTNPAGKGGVKSEKFAIFKLWSRVKKLKDRIRYS